MSCLNCKHFDNKCTYEYNCSEKVTLDKAYQQGRTDAIDEIEKLLLDRFTCDDLRTDWTNADIRETIHFELEQLKEKAE